MERTYKQSLSIYSMASAGRKLHFPKRVSEVRGQKPEQKSLSLSCRKQRQALAFSGRAASTEDVVPVASLLLLQRGSGLRAWLQALLMAFSPGAVWLG